MTYVYYIDNKKFTTDDSYNKIPWYVISSPNEQTPAFEDLNTGYKFWCKTEEIIHRLTGPAVLYLNGSEQFWLNGKIYENVREWINDHPNPDFYLDELGLNETGKILWYLQN